MAHAARDFSPEQITRPDPALLKYYILVAGCTLVAFPFVMLPLFFRFHTLRYRLDDDGVSMAWGIIFRREIYLTYRRVQDIHVTRNIFQRWFGLASVAVQTASGSSGAEMTIEGILEPEKLRDFLYSKMRGAREEQETEGARNDEALELLGEIRDALKKS